LVTPFGFDDTDFSEVLGILNNGFGIIGAIIASLLLRGASEKEYKAASIISNVLTILSFSYFILAVTHIKT
jgi:Na+/melibiose symporter-like transporter